MSVAGRGSISRSPIQSSQNPSAMSMAETFLHVRQRPDQVIVHHSLKRIHQGAHTRSLLPLLDQQASIGVNVDPLGQSAHDANTMVMSSGTTVSRSVNSMSS